MAWRRNGGVSASMAACGNMAYGGAHRIWISNGASGVALAAS
jgi:hypothetical protein